MKADSCHPCTMRERIIFLKQAIITGKYGEYKVCVRGGGGQQDPCMSHLSKSTRFNSDPCESLQNTVRTITEPPLARTTPC